MKKSSGKTAKTSDSNAELNKKLIENFVALQKIMTNLSAKFDNLSDQITKLLQIFEISAKAMAEKDFEQFQNSDDKKVIEKLDALLEQNKTIAKGLALLHEKPSQEQPGYVHAQILPQKQMPARNLLPSERSRLQQRPQNPQNYY